LTINGYQNIGFKFAVFFAAIVIHANQPAVSKFRPIVFLAGCEPFNTVLQLSYNQIFTIDFYCKLNLFSIVYVLKISTDFWGL